MIKTQVWNNQVMEKYGIIIDSSSNCFFQVGIPKDRESPSYKYSYSNNSETKHPDYSYALTVYCKIYGDKGL